VVYETMYWHPEALGVKKGEGDKGYVVFGMEDWDRLRASGEGGEAKL
jgi:hypothetical protein